MENYVFLTDEMKKILDEKIKSIGKKEFYDIVTDNINTLRIQQLQNEPDAFDKCYRDGCEYQYEHKFFYTPVVLDPHLSLDSEMLHYIDKDRFESGDVHILNRQMVRRYFNFK